MNELFDWATAKGLHYPVLFAAQGALIYFIYLAYEGWKKTKRERQRREHDEFNREGE